MMNLRVFSGWIKMRNHVQSVIFRLARTEVATMCGVQSARILFVGYVKDQEICAALTLVSRVVISQGTRVI